VRARDRGIARRGCVHIAPMNERAARCHGNVLLPAYRDIMALRLELKFDGHWRRQLWGTGARAPTLDFQLVKF